MELKSVVIKNASAKETALNRISVRRLFIQARKLISAVSIRLLFEQMIQLLEVNFINLLTLSWITLEGT
jgi:hypothetical protein